MNAQYGSLREDHLIPPMAGKAFPVRRGEVYRIVQEVGRQCVDINVWGLHDYREYMDSSIMRRQGFLLDVGDFMISNAPYSRLMLKLLHKSEANAFTTLASRCNSALIEERWGVHPHSNCQDSLAEAAREYGLEPHHVHPVPCPWMPVDWDDAGNFTVGGNRHVPQGDYMDFLAMEDVLFASCVCGSADYLDLGAYWPEPVRIQIFERSAETERMVQETQHQYPPLRGQLAPQSDDSTNDYTARRIDDYEPNYINFPIQYETVDVSVSRDVQAAIQQMIDSGARDDQSDAVRTAVMQWYLANKTDLGRFGRTKVVS